MKTILLLAVLFCLAGCARFSSTITETTDAGGVTTRITVVKATTFWDSGSELTKLSSGQTDKSQKVSIGGLNQESSGTNAVVLIQVLSDAAAKAMVPKP